MLDFFLSKLRSVISELSQNLATDVSLVFSKMFSNIHRWNKYVSNNLS